MALHIGPHQLRNNLALAPMAGVTDLPFRLLCRRMGAALAAGEMLTSDVRLWHTEKSRRRMDHSGESEPRVVQIAGGDAQMMAQAARLNAAAGAQIIDINMGCPVKKVCNKAAGSALLRDEPLVREILEAVVKAVQVPVTLKIRTGWDPSLRNGVHIARLAEDCGVQALAVHGRTRACMFRGAAEYETIRAIKQSVAIPVFANGDIDSAHKALWVLEQTGVDGVMVGRSAQGRPWIFREIEGLLREGVLPPEPSLTEVRDIMLAHLRDLHAFYGEEAGVRVARKHIDWYAKGRSGAHPLRQAVMSANEASLQLDLAAEYFVALGEAHEISLGDAA
jgi:tRNA-dihydrouridine synthase B